MKTMRDGQTEKRGVNGLEANGDATSDELLRSVLTQTDRLDVIDDTVEIDGHPVTELLSEYGSPLYVVIESTLRENYRRVYAAFDEAWPTAINVMYAIKANNNVAVRAIIHDEGGGGDCFGMGELRATLDGGADVEKLALNGSNKGIAELSEAVRLGIRVNIDAEDEVDMLAQICAETSARARVSIRLKIAPPSLDELSSTSSVHGSRLQEYILNEKWGFSQDATVALIARISEHRTLDLDGYHVHMGRIGQDPLIQGTWCSALGAEIVELSRITGFMPKVLDIGGGWARERDPESRSLDRNQYTIEDYASVVAKALLPCFERAGIPVPMLCVEPGRYVSGNSAVLLGTVGAVKRDIGRTWINVDVSTNNLARVDSEKYEYHVLPATGMSRPRSAQACVVGSTCTQSIIVQDGLFPEMRRGDVMMVLDAGMYSETTSNQYNGIPRPATVLVNGDSVEIIKRRETIEDMFALHHVPERLRGPGS